MKKIKTIKEAINYVEKNVCEVSDLTNFKYHIYDNEDDYGYIKDDKEFIDYANEQKEAIEN